MKSWKANLQPTKRFPYAPIHALSLLFLNALQSFLVSIYVGVWGMDRARMFASAAALGSPAKNVCLGVSGDGQLKLLRPFCCLRVDTNWRQARCAVAAGISQTAEGGDATYELHDAVLRETFLNSISSGSGTTVVVLERVAAVLAAFLVRIVAVLVLVAILANE